MAARVLLNLENIRLSFGGKPLFEDVSIHLLEGDRVCLVGKNGAGKTTLMRLITGEQEPDAGTRFTYPGLTIGYLAQQVPFQDTQTVKDFVLSNLPKDDHFEEKSYLADMMLSPLDLQGEDTMGILSGGQLRRAALARALLEEPDVLLLDEPTNHLDVGAIEWLEQYLARYRGALLCISHDRAFLKAVSQKVFWIDRGLVRTCPKGYEGFDDWAEILLEQEAREIQNMEKKLDAEVDWTQGGVTGRRKRNQRRVRELHRLRDKLRQGKAAYKHATSRIELEALPPSQASKMIAEFKGVHKSFDRQGRSVPILQDFSYRLMRGDRLGVLGKNGSGKSTFLKLLTGELAPDQGHIRRGKTLDISYFDQHRTALNPRKTVWDTLCPDGGDHVFIGSGEEQKAIHVCGYLKNFLFDPRLARELVGTLSGGQQNRLMLAKALAQPGNVLILDEPTNDLDMDTLDMLQEIIADYQGTLLLVSHDRDFLDRTVSRVLAFEGEGVVESHVGGYSDYAAFKKNEGMAASSASTPKPRAKEGTLSSLAVAIPTGSTKMSFKLKHELEKLPSTINTLVTEIAILKDQLADAGLYQQNPKAFDHAMRRLPAAETALEKAEERWLELQMMAEG